MANAGWALPFLSSRLSRRTLQSFTHWRQPAGHPIPEPSPSHAMTARDCFPRASHLTRGELLETAGA